MAIGCLYVDHLIVILVYSGLISRFFKMRFTADLHMHTDPGHGDSPQNIAMGIVNSGIDAYAITEHRHPSDRAFDVRNEVEKILYGSGLRIAGLIGVELNLAFGGGMYHAGYIFENPNLCRGQLPPDPKKMLTVREYEEYKRAYPGVSIFYHPAWHDGNYRKRNDPAVTEELMRSGLFNGIELLNGLILTNGVRAEITESTVQMFLDSRKRRLRLAAMGNSDAHRGIRVSAGAANYVGTAVTEFCHREPSGVLEAIKNGETMAVAVDQKVKRRVTALLRRVNGAGRYLK